MANTFTQIYVHLVFAVKWRECILAKDHREEIHKYIAGILKHKNQKLIAVNSMPDHIHILVGIKPHICISDLVMFIKISSSKFINQKNWYKGKFNWQKGFGAFSFGHSQISMIADYIHNQEKHHYKRTFREEYIEILHKFNIEYNDLYIFDELK